MGSTPPDMPPRPLAIVAATRAALDSSDKSLGEVLRSNITSREDTTTWSGFEISAGSGSGSLFTDGYIACTFTPEVAEFYLVRLFKIDARLIRWFHHQGVFYVRDQPVNTTRPPHRIFEQDNAWLLDYHAKRDGSVVPQQIWVPQGQGDRPHYVESPQWQMPLFFVNVDGTLGVPIMNAAAGQMNLHGAGEAVPFGERATTKIRICWPGYSPSESQVQLRDQTPLRNPVTLERFVKHVAARVRHYLIECEDVAIQDPVRNWKWRVAHDNITFYEVMLIGVIQVSAGSWMPILQLRERDTLIISVC